MTVGGDPVPIVPGYTTTDWSSCNYYLLLNTKLDKDYAVYGFEIYGANPGLLFINVNITNKLKICLKEKISGTFKCIFLF